MTIDTVTNDKLKEYNDNLFSYIKDSYTLYDTLYLDLGTKIVRLLCFSNLFIPHIKNQLTYSLKENCEKFDATIVLWQENEIKSLLEKISPELSLRNNLKLRAFLLVTAQYNVLCHQFSSVKPVLSVNINTNIINSFDIDSNTYFYGVKDLQIEEFIKHGHIFVQILNNILKTDNTNLVHGACVGLNNKGVLLCARGQRGKSTLSVLSMLEGFDYVSDDYLTLEKDKDNLYAYPIYSIITLSPPMYNKLKDKLNGAKFVSMNSRKDKLVINISNFHSQFRKRYPIKMCMFPEIVSDNKPSIQECTKEVKGRAITHLVHSTISQMNDLHDTKTIKKLIDMVNGFRFYKIYLCSNIDYNTQCLKQFLLRESYND